MFSTRPLFMGLCEDLCGCFVFVLAGVEFVVVTLHGKKLVVSTLLDDVAVADVKDMAFNAEGGSFAAIVEVKPVFKLPTYKGLKLTSNDVTVKDADVDDQIARLRAAYATYEDAKEGDAVAEGDFVQIDYSGTVGGKSILELNPEAKVVASGEGFWTQVEEGRFLPEILDALKGMKAGETKEGVKAKFDKESAPEGLKGEKAVYTVTLKSFRRRILPGIRTPVLRQKRFVHKTEIHPAIRTRMNMKRKFIAFRGQRIHGKRDQRLVIRTIHRRPPSRRDHPSGRLLERTA